MATASHESSGAHLEQIFHFFFLEKIFWIFGRPFRDVGADVPPSRRDGWLRAGRVSLGIAPRGPGDVWELSSEVVFIGEHLPYKFRKSAPDDLQSSRDLPCPVKTHPKIFGGL